MWDTFLCQVFSSELNRQKSLPLFVSIETIQTHIKMSSGVRNEASEGEREGRGCYFT